VGVIALQPASTAATATSPIICQTIRLDEYIADLLLFHVVHGSGRLSNMLQPHK
jgi:hypothetical protein